MANKRARKKGRKVQSFDYCQRNKLAGLPLSQAKSSSETNKNEKNNGNSLEDIPEMKEFKSLSLHDEHVQLRKQPTSQMTHYTENDFQEYLDLKFFAKIPENVRNNLRIVCNKDEKFFLNSMKEIYYKYCWSQEQKRDKDQGEYTPEKLLDLALEYLNEDDYDHASDKIWESFNCSVSHYFADLPNMKINIRTDTATNILAFILISCHSEVKTALRLEGSRDCANLSHRLSFLFVTKDVIMYRIEKIKFFNEEIKKIDKTKVEKKIQSYGTEKIELRAVPGSCHVYPHSDEEDYIFGYKFKFNYSADDEKFANKNNI